MDENVEAETEETAQDPGDALGLKDDKFWDVEYVTLKRRHVLYGVVAYAFVLGFLCGKGR